MGLHVSRSIARIHSSSLLFSLSMRCLSIEILSASTCIMNYFAATLRSSMEIMLWTLSSFKLRLSFRNVSFWRCKSFMHDRNSEDDCCNCEEELNLFLESLAMYLPMGRLPNPVEGELHAPSTFTLLEPLSSKASRLPASCVAPLPSTSFPLFCKSNHFTSFFRISQQCV